MFPKYVFMLLHWGIQVPVNNSQYCSEPQILKVKSANEETCCSTYVCVVVCARMHPCSPIDVCAVLYKIGYLWSRVQRSCFYNML